MIANWRLVFATTSNDKTIDSFDASIQELSRLIGKAGQLRATISIPNDEVGRRLKRVQGQEGRISVYAYRDSVLWWGGFVDATRVEANVSETVLVIEGSTYESYPTRREARKDGKLTSIDQFQLAKWIWEDMQKAVGGDIHVETGRVGNCGIKRTVEWKRSEIKTWDQILSEVVNSDDGFEWIVDTFDDGARRRRELTCGYPIIGRPKSDWVLSFPGQINTYSIDGSALDGATSFQARGKAPDPVGVPGKKGNKDGTGGGGTPAAAQEPIMSKIYETTALHTKGYTRTDATVDRPKVTNKTVLDEWAKAAASLRSGPLVLPEITCRVDDINTALLGYTVKIRIRDTAYPAGPLGEPGYEADVRVIGIQVDPGEQGFDDVVKLIFENPHSDDVLAQEVTYDG